VIQVHDPHVRSFSSGSCGQQGDGKVTRLVLYTSLEQALTDLDLEE
jgi:hypothetical protein